MEQYGNLSTYNLESVLNQNIKNSDYYRNDCAKLLDWESVIDAIYDQVDYIEPWLAGNARGPSTAFCLLHRLFTLKPTEEQVHLTITHGDSVYIRAVGFLYLRYVCPPKQLWEWMGPYCNDAEEIQPSGPNGPTVTVGDFVRDLLLEQYYYETIFPRIPKKVEDDIQAELRKRGLPTRGKGNGGCGGPDRRGGDDGNRRPASVKASLSVAFGQRAPNRAGTKDTARYKAAEEAAAGGRDRSYRSRSRSRSLSREVRRNGAAGTPERYQRDRPGSSLDNRDRDRDRDRDKHRDYDRRGGYDSRDRDRGYDRERERGYDRDKAYDSRGGSSRGHDSRDRDRGDKGYTDRGGSSRGSYDRDRSERSYADRERERDYSRRRSRSRSRSPARGGGRDARDVFREKAMADGSAAATDIRSRYGDASGKLDLGSSGSGRRTDEVFRLGGRGYR